MSRSGSNEAARFYAAPGQRVPNNPLNANSLLAPQSRPYSNPYLDGAYANLPGTTAQLNVLPPADPRARLAEVQSYQETEIIGDLHWAGRLSGDLSGPLAAEPNGIIQSPGIAAEAQRYPTGHPGQVLLPPTSMMGPAPQREVVGKPSDARFPRRPAR
jgi:hypothetical protein